MSVCLCVQKKMLQQWWQLTKGLLKRKDVYRLKLQFSTRKKRENNSGQHFKMQESQVV